MTNMRERIARAMCGPSWDATNFNETPDGSSPEENREYYYHMADLALSELRSPTEAMRKAGWVEMEQRDELLVWSVMLAAAGAE